MPKAETFLPLKTNWFHILLSLAGEDQHGYGIMQEVLDRTDGKVRLWPATLYGSLKRLIEAGLIEESEERPAPRIRRRPAPLLSPHASGPPRARRRERASSGIGANPSSKARSGGSLMKSLALRIYRRLALAFPHEFQMVYGADVIHLGEEAIDDIWTQQGLFGLIRLIADIAMRLPVEYLAEMRSDLAYALRTLKKSPGFAAVGILSLGLGIGIATFSASEFFNLILRAAPGVKDPDQLVLLPSTSYPYFERYRDQHDLVAGAAAFQGPIPFNVSLNSGPAANTKAERVFGHLVSPDYLSVIGVRAARGRTFDPQIDQPGSEPVVFISDRFWRNRMEADPDAVGRAIHVNGQIATIIGIGPKDFLGVVPIRPAEIFVPTTSPSAMVPELAGDVLHKPDVKYFQALFRLAPGVTLKSAEAGLDTLTRHLDQESLDPARNSKGAPCHIGDWRENGAHPALPLYP